MTGITGCPFPRVLSWRRRAANSKSACGGAALVLALAACVPVSHPGARPALRTAETTEAGQTLAARGNTAWPPDQWWRLAGDPQLTALNVMGLHGRRNDGIDTQGIA